MGKLFGNLAYIRGVIYYRLSPHEQKPFAGAITHGIPNFFPRTKATILTWLPAFVLGYLVYVGTESAYRQKLRKNPQDYANEVDPNPPVVAVEEEVLNECVPRKKKTSPTPASPPPEEC